MRFKPLVFLSLIALFIAVRILPTSAATASVNVTITPSTVWWNNTVTVDGVAKYTNGTAIPSGSVDVLLTGASIKKQSYCTNTTDAAGVYSCKFYAPLELGVYEVTVNVTKDGESFYGSTELTVKLVFGERYTGTEDRIVYEVPMLLQDMSGRVKKALVRLILWRGS